MINPTSSHADHVGSLLRPQHLKDARLQHALGDITAQQLRAAEDEAIREVIAQQERIGLNSITDGEFRRSFWHLDFMGGLQNVESYEAAQGIQFKGGQTKPLGLKVTGKLAPVPHYMLDHWKFVAANTRGMAKAMMPSPTVLHYRGGRKAIDLAAYPEMDGFYHDLGIVFREAIRELGEAGCQYVQLDEVNYTYLCDEEQRQMLRARGDDPDQLPGIYADLINAAVAGRTEGMSLAMHLCRGNFRSMWIASGGYEPVADVLFNQLNIETYFMEWDTERAGGFEPLRLVPKNKRIVLGIMSSKLGDLETKETIKRRLDDAARYIDLDQLSLSPQCGFASTEEGNTLSEQQQWAKLRLVVEVAAEVWGSAALAPIQRQLTAVR
jgi:5-methyltetrahydropteroyltriglutamate--homocysteine methyltransferase